MKFLPLIWAMLWRRKTRTALTFASIAVAFMLFGMLHAFSTLLSTGARLAAADSLITSNRYGFLKSLPIAYRSQIEAVAGVRAVIPVVIFPFKYQDANSSSQPSMATDQDIIFAADPRFVVAPAQVKAFQETRTGMIAGRFLAEKYGWKIGDHIPLMSPWVKRKDGAAHWEFDLVGIFDFNEALMGKGVSASRVFVRYDYVDEARVNPGEVDIFVVKVRDPAQAPAVAKAVDALFQNSAHPTKSQSEAEQQRSQLAQIGDIGLIITAILSAVFFTLVVVAGNTMMRAFRERIPELATLKTLGFTDGSVAVLVALESLMLCLSAGLFGLGLAWLILKPIAKAIAAVLPLLRMKPETVITGVALAAALGVIGALIPAWQSARLSVVDGLRRR